MPAVITCAERVAQPVKVKPGASDEAATRPIQVVRAAELGADAKEFGLAGSPTWVQEVRVVETPKTECKFIDATDAERAATEIMSRRSKHSARSSRACTIAARSDRRGAQASAVATSGSCARPTSKAASRAARSSCCHAATSSRSRLGGALVAIGFDGTVARHAGLLASFGADHVLTLEHPALVSYTPEAAAEAVAKIVSTHAPWGILIGATERGRDWGPRLAARLGLGLTGDAIDIELDSENRMVALKPAFGGNIVAPIYSKTFPQMATVRPGVLELAAPSEARQAEVQNCARRDESAEKPAHKGALDPRSHRRAARRRRSCRRHRHRSRRTRRRRESRRVRANCSAPRCARRAA